VENKTFNPNNIELTEEANEIFKRVWKRVIPDSQESPIVVEPIKYGINGTPSGTTDHASELSFPSSDEFPVSIQEQSNQMVHDQPQLEPDSRSAQLAKVEPYAPEASHYKNDFPPRSAVPCLGSQNLHYEELLKAMIRKELQNWAYYRTLARRAGGSAARVLASMASEDWQNAKRLSAAHFLISGVQFWPERAGTPNITSYLTSLRDRFIDEQQDAAQYIANATESTDPCLSQLLLDIAEGNLRHAYQIRLLIEQL
jgi:rubrerythrin